MFTHQLHHLTNLCLRSSTLLALLLSCPLAPAQSFKDYTGTWEFTIAGDDTGKGTAVVDAQGRIKGVGSAAKLQMPLTLAGQLQSNGKAQFNATPQGSTSSGAQFTGQLDTQGHGSGTWQSPQYRTTGSWRAQRKTVKQDALPTQQTFQCEIDGVSTDNPEARADLMMDTRKGKADFRVISIVPDQYSMDVKTKKVNAPGNYAIVNDPGWSTDLRIAKRQSNKMNGTWNFKVFDIAAKRATGTVSFDAGPHQGMCRFDLFLFIADFSNMPLPR
jgi:hypothetical protein